MSRNMLYGLIAFGVLVGLVILQVLIGVSGETPPAKTGSGFSTLFYIAVVALIGFVILGAFNRAGGAGGAAQWVIAVIAITIVAYGVADKIRFGTQSNKVRTALQERNVKVALSEGSKGQNVPKKPEIVVQVSEIQTFWDGVNEGDVLPVGVWSDTAKSTGCDLKFAPGNGFIYQTRTRYCTGNYCTDWEIQKPGTTGIANETQARILKPGITELPFTMTCRS